MPHSSVGGFHGGGFHGGGFSGHHYGRGGAHSGITISRHHFPGATAWLYYTSRGVPHIVYSTSDITTMPKGAGVFSFFLLGIFALAPLVMMFATGAKHPEQVILPYNNTIVIEDKANVFTPSDEARLVEVLNDFKSVSHVVPAIYTVNNNSFTVDAYTVGTGNAMPVCGNTAIMSADSPGTLNTKPADASDDDKTDYDWAEWTSLNPNLATVEESQKSLFNAKVTIKDNASAVLRWTVHKNGCTAYDQVTI
ncbi:MAG: hypothetical protein IKP56_03440, partial [Bacilli bacterium]|nr:hypothetical protein [Bacilli bacterium]